MIIIIIFILSIVCEEGFWGNSCSKDCNCRNIATICDPVVGCNECALGFTAGDCKTDLDECIEYPCKDNATCINTIGAYTCLCPIGFSPHNNTNCKGMFFI